MSRTPVLVVTALVLLLLPTGARAGRISGLVPDLPTGADPLRTAAPLRSPGPVRARVASVTYGGGPVVHSSRTHLIFWQPAGSGLSFDPGYASLIETFLGRVAADSHLSTNLYGLTGQYRDHGGPAQYASSFAGAIIDTEPLPQPAGCVEPPPPPLGAGPGWTPCVSDAQIETEISRVLGAYRLPSGMHDIYFLVTPNGLGDCEQAGPDTCALGGPSSGYCGYHFATASGILYAVIPYAAVPGHCQSNGPRPNSSTADPAVSTIAHENTETLTDPLGTGWMDGPASGAGASLPPEIADLCITNYGADLGGSGGAGAYNEVIHGGHYYLQELWSNIDHACEPSAAPDAVSFATPRAVPGDRSLSLLGTATARAGPILSYEWFFGGRRGASGPNVRHTFTALGRVLILLRTTDRWGNWGFASHTVRVMLPPHPVTRITEAPKRLMPNSRPRFRFGSSAAIATFQCRIDDHGWSPCSSPLTTPPLAKGGHRFSVRARDSFGQLAPEPASRAFTVS